jgi:hypothetical protein
VADPNAKRDKALDSLVDEMRKQTRLLGEQSRAIVGLSRAMVSASDAIVLMAQALSSDEPVEESDPELGEISVLVAPLSVNELDEAGYELHQSNVGLFIRVPRLRKMEEPSAPPE